MITLRTRTLLAMRKSEIKLKDFLLHATMLKFIKDRGYHDIIELNKKGAKGRLQVSYGYILNISTDLYGRLGYLGYCYCYCYLFGYLFFFRWEKQL